MISVIIPLMPIKPYNSIYLDAIDALEKQTIECEVIVSKQDVEPYINKGRLINQGIERASGDVIWLCDADFIPEPTLLERMAEKLSEVDVVYPMFFSGSHQKLKIADGAPMFNKKLLDEYGSFNETHLGISWVTFPFLNWCLRYKELYCSNQYIVEINLAPQRKAGKRHYKTAGKLRQVYKDTVKKLQKMEVWP